MDCLLSMFRTKWENPTKTNQEQLYFCHNFMNYLNIKIFNSRQIFKLTYRVFPILTIVGIRTLGHRHLKSFILTEQSSKGKTIKKTRRI